MPDEIPPLIFLVIILDVVSTDARISDAQNDVIGLDDRRPSHKMTSQLSTPLLFKKWQRIQVDSHICDALGRGLGRSQISALNVEQ